MIPEDVLSRIAAYLQVPSAISHHDQACCRDALAWLRGIDAVRSFWDGHWHPPTWVRQEYDWGPVSWPMHWCSLFNAEVLDCGALASVAVALYRLRSLAATTVQLALRYPPHAAEQWSQMWAREGLSNEWIIDGICYHEVCGVVEGTQLSLWDPTENRWLSPPSSSHDGFGSIVAINIAQPNCDPLERVDWSGYSLHVGRWYRLPVEGAKSEIKAGLEAFVQGG